MHKMEFRIVIQSGSYTVIELNCLDLSSKNQFFFLFIITDFADTPFFMIVFFHDK